jgi:hypothetical protein
MRTYFSFAALGLALAVGTPLANAQSLVTSPNEIFDIPPSGSLLGPMPMVDVSSGVLQPKQTVETVQTVPARPANRNQGQRITIIQPIAVTCQTPKRKARQRG